MNSTRMGELIATLRASDSRRGALKTAGAAAALGLSALAGQDSAAKKKGKKKRKQQATPPSAATCAPGTLVASVNVPANGATALTPNLRPGQPYRLRAVGFWSSNAEFGNDAFAAFKFSAPGVAVKEFEGVRLGLAVDFTSPDDWGSYTANHIYERRVVGQGGALPLRCTDPITNDNVGAIVVDVFCD